MSSHRDWDQLLAAAQKNDAERIRKLVEAGVSPSHSNPIGQSAVHIASLWGNVEAVKALVEVGADLNARNQMTGATPLHCAVQSTKKPAERRVISARCLLEAGANLYEADFYGGTPMDHLSEADEDSGMKQLLFEFDQKNLSKTHKLLEFMDQVNIDEIREFLEKEPSVVTELIGNSGRTPLLYMVDKLLDCNRGSYGHPRDAYYNVCSLLLEKGADPNDAGRASSGEDEFLMPGMEIDHSERLAIHRVCQALYKNQNPDDEDLFKRVVRLLLEKGATIPSCTVHLLHDAARRNKLQILQFLIETCNVNMNEKGRQGMTPLHFAARSGHVPIVQYLLERKEVDLSLRDDSGKTALDAARVVDNRQAVISLIEKQLQK